MTSSELSLRERIEGHMNTGNAPAVDTLLVLADRLLVPHKDRAGDFQEQPPSIAESRVTRVQAVVTGKNTNDQIYLSDGGFSRLIIGFEGNPPRPYVEITPDSIPEVIERWNTYYRGEI